MVLLPEIWDIILDHVVSDFIGECKKVLEKSPKFKNLIVLTQAESLYITNGINFDYLTNISNVCIDFRNILFKKLFVQSIKANLFESIIFNEYKKFLCRIVPYSEDIDKIKIFTANLKPFNRKVKESIGIKYVHSVVKCSEIWKKGYYLNITTEPFINLNKYKLVVVINIDKKIYGYFLPVLVEITDSGQIFEVEIGFTYTRSTPFLWNKTFEYNIYIIPKDINIRNRALLRYNILDRYKPRHCLKSKDEQNYRLQIDNLVPFDNILDKNAVMYTSSNRVIRIVSK